MSKRLILILALAFVVGIAFAAYAEVQNVKVSGDLLMQGVARDNCLYTNAAKNQSHKERGFLSQVRVRIDADLTDNVSTTVRLLNERVWGKEGYSDPTTPAQHSTDIDLDLAYATLKEFLYSPLTLVVGRQELRYGNGLVIGDIDTNAVASTDSNLPASTTLRIGMQDLSLRKSFDAVKAVLNYDPLVVDLVAAKIEDTNLSLKTDVDLVGINASYAARKDLATEVYLWSRDRHWGGTGLATPPGQGERLNVLGTRGVYTGIKDLVLGLEAAWQFGDHVILGPDELTGGTFRNTGAKSRVNASAIQFTSNYAIPTLKRFAPAVGFNYTRLSGEKDKEDSLKYGGWDAMFEDQSGGTLFNKLVGYSNVQLLNLCGTMKPMEDVTVKLDWYNIRLLQTFNTTTSSLRYLSGVSTDAATTIKGGKHGLANEVDLGVTYDYTEDVQIGLAGAMYIPGAVYDKVNKKTATQLIGSMKVTF